MLEEKIINLKLTESELNVIKLALTCKLVTESQQNRLTEKELTSKVINAIDVSLRYQGEKND